MKIKNLKLIDGTFDASEAFRVLSGVLNSKISYHQLEDFSNHIRFNGEISNSKNRIAELQNSQKELIDLMEYAKLEGKKILIKSDIVIEILD